MQHPGHPVSGGAEKELGEECGGLHSRPLVPRARAASQARGRSRHQVSATEAQQAWQCPSEANSRALPSRRRSSATALPAASSSSPAIRGAPNYMRRQFGCQ